MNSRTASHPHTLGPEESSSPATGDNKKPFVEPAISSPVDVLEATTFFQAVESGGTGLTGKKPGGGGD
jgi:hypothetical protein